MSMYIVLNTDIFADWFKRYITGVGPFGSHFPGNANQFDFIPRYVPILGIAQIYSDLIEIYITG